jgi:RHS repeat-associated protein
MFGLVNMNARLYDPAVGRFLSPDPYVQTPDFSQNFNRYSYVLNNPLKYTDPSGEKWWHWLIGDIFTGGLLSSTAIGFAAGTAGAAIGTAVTVGSSAYGAYLPFSNEMYMMQKFISPIAIKPSFHTGSDVFGLGFDLSVGMPSSTSSYRWHFGGTYYHSYYDNAYSGWEWRKGTEVTLLPGISYSGTTYSSGEISQTNNLLTLGLPFSSISYENNSIKEFQWIPGVPKGSGDKFRTAAVQFNIMGAGFGFNIFTGDKGNGAYVEEDGKQIYTLNKRGDPDQYRFGGLFFKFGPIRVGRNTENIRAGIQNTIHNWTGDPHYRKLDRPKRFYWYFGTGTGNTLW